MKVSRDLVVMFGLSTSYKYTWNSVSDWKSNLFDLFSSEITQEKYYHAVNCLAILHSALSFESLSYFCTFTLHQNVLPLFRYYHRVEKSKRRTKWWENTVWHLTVAEIMQILTKFPRDCRMKPDNNQIDNRVLNWVAVWTLKYLIQEWNIERKNKIKFKYSPLIFTTYCYYNFNPWGIWSLWRHFLSFCNQALEQGWLMAAVNYRKLKLKQNDFWCS